MSESPVLNSNKVSPYLVKIGDITKSNISSFESYTTISEYIIVVCLNSPFSTNSDNNYGGGVKEANAYFCSPRMSEFGAYIINQFNSGAPMTDDNAPKFAETFVQGTTVKMSSEVNITSATISDVTVKMNNKESVICCSLSVKKAEIIYTPSQNSDSGGNITASVNIAKGLN